MLDMGQQYFRLREAGAEVLIAANGRIAAELATSPENAGKFDLILMDMQMPELDGYGATTALREGGYRNPIVALTAHAMGGDRERCMAAGCDDFAVKPIDHAAFMTTLRKFIREEFAPDTPTASAAAALAAAPPPASPQPINGDADSTLSKLMSKPNTAKLVERFLTGLPQRITAIEEAAAKPDWNQLKVLTHQLKGAAGGYGFAAVSVAAANVEAAVTANADAEEIGKQVRSLAQLCAALRGVAA
jgi:CheY-like chemotaxis protein